MKKVLSTHISFNSSCRGISVEGMNKVRMVITLSDFFLLVSAGETDLFVTEDRDKLPFHHGLK
jgi:hypothetical protein